MAFDGIMGRLDDESILIAVSLVNGDDDEQTCE
jgi:hypothetical protein